MAPIIADNSIESGCEFVDNSNTVTIDSNSAITTTNDSYFSETNVESSSSSLENFKDEEVVNVSRDCEVKEEISNNDENVRNNQQQQKERMPWEAPGKQGLYDPQNEHEACGVGFIVAIDGKRSHKVSPKFRELHIH